MEGPPAHLESWPESDRIDGEGVRAKARNAGKASTAPEGPLQTETAARDQALRPVQRPDGLRSCGRFMGCPGRLPLADEKSDWTNTWARTQWCFYRSAVPPASLNRLASLRGQLFSDDDFAEIYGPDNGRDSVPPSLLATALLLQTYDKVSDAEAKARADFDIRWKVALGIEIEDRPFAKSTLQMFRAQLILHDKVREVFEGSLRLARQSGYLKKRGMRVALDTTYILGRGAVKDTYNLLADGIVKLLRVLAAVANIAVGEWAEGQGYERYFGSSIKGEAVIDWSDRRARAALLAELVS